MFSCGAHVQGAVPSVQESTILAAWGANYCEGKDLTNYYNIEELIF